jgi:tetraacyldisaccharide-1-P 4'-kinase
VPRGSKRGAGVGEARGGEGAAGARVPVDWLRGRRVVTMLGVGNARAVAGQIESAGARIMASVAAGDHERYGRAKVAHARGLCGGAEALVVTPKDWVKLRELIDPADWPGAIVVPELAIEFIAGEEELDALIWRAAAAG